MKLTGKRLNARYRLGAVQARYRENGVWYHPLSEFPAVLFDKGGYVLFTSASEYFDASFIKHGPDPNHIHIIGGLSNARGYRALKPAPCEFDYN